MSEARKEEPFWLKHNFAPVYDEVTVTDLKVTGEITIAGWVRYTDMTSKGPLFMYQTSSHDGDVMVNIKEGGKSVFSIQYLQYSVFSIQYSVLYIQIA